MRNVGVIEKILSPRRAIEVSRDEQQERDADPEPEVPEPDAAPAEHVVFAMLLALEAEEARPGDEPPEDQVHETAERDHDQYGHDYRFPQRPVIPAHEERDERGAREEGDEGRRAGQLPPTGRELAVDCARCELAAASGLQRIRNEGWFEAGHRLTLRDLSGRGSRRGRSSPI